MTFLCTHLTSTRLVACLCTRGHTTSKILIRYLTLVVRERLYERKKDVKKRLHRVRLCARYSQRSYESLVPLYQWIIDSSPSKDPWTEQRITQEVLALWFASVHQLEDPGQ